MALRQTIQEDKNHSKKIEQRTGINEKHLCPQFDGIVANQNRELVNSSLFWTIF